MSCQPSQFNLPAATCARRSLDRDVHDFGERLRINAHQQHRDGEHCRATRISRPIDIRQLTHVRVGDRAEDHALVHPQRVRGAEDQRGGGEEADQKLALMAPRMTMNSPTKPLVPGRPELAMREQHREERRTWAWCSPRRRSRRSVGCACGRTARRRTGTWPRR